MLKTLLIASLLLLLELSAAAQQSQPSPKAASGAPYVIPVEAVRQANPVKPTPESIARGQEMVWIRLRHVPWQGR